MELWYCLTIAFIIFIIIELIFRSIIVSVNKKFQWMIIDKDELPILSEDGLKKFIPHGYDPELGWNRKPDTFHKEIGKNEKATQWTINSNGVRTNPGFDKINSKISCNGDSFTFCRQVNDNETWEHF